MDKMDRRRLLTGAALGSAALVGASALGSTAPEAAFADESLDIEDGPDPNFFEGRITSINGVTLTIMDSENVIRMVRVAEATSIWKLHPTSLKAVEVGDGLYARGVQLEDGTLAAESVWVNIVNLHVEIVSIGAGAMELAHNDDPIIGHVVPGVTAIMDENDVATADLSMLEVGSHFQFIGAWRPDTDEFDIATIYLD